MRSLVSLFAVSLFLPAAFALAQYPPVSKTPTANPTPSPEMPSYKDLLDIQEKRYEKFYEQQKDISDKTIGAILQQQQALRDFFALASGFVVVFSTIGIFILRHAYKLYISDEINNLRRDVDKVRIEFGDKMQKEIERVQTEYKQRQQELDEIRNEFDEKRKQIDGFHNELTNLLSEHEEEIKDINTKAAMAKFRSELLSTDVDIRWRAVQGISERATLSGGAIVLPILLECLRNPNEEAKVLKEALYGLSHRGKEIMDDSQAIQIIATMYEHPTASVRLETIKLMGKIGPTHTKFQQCLQRCSESDPDTDVQAEARQIIHAITV